MNDIYTGQPVPLKATISDKDGLVDMRTNSLIFTYFFPGNTTAVPDGNVVGDVSAGVAGVVTGLIPSVLNTLSGQLRIQSIATVDGEEWPAQTLKTLNVLKRGD